jgi:hypothetical protein
VHYGTSSGEYTNIVDIDGQDNTSCDLDALNLVPAQTYYFAVSAYSTAGLEGSLSLPISYTTPYEDSDNDGMDDGWEVDNGLDPFVDDADGDLDDDGITNLEEYYESSSAANKGPDKPVLKLPGDSTANISLTPQFITNAYVDHENDTHAKTQWQIGTEQTFTIPENILFEQETYDSLTNLTIPEFIIETNKTYYWRVRFFDVLNGRSLWSEIFSFTTLTNNPEDSDGNGVPDIQQVEDGIIDLNDDGYLDVLSSTYKMVTNGHISISLEASNYVTDIEHLKAINPDDISDTFGKPDDLQFGLIQFKIGVNNPGDTAHVNIYFSEPVGKNWYKYDIVNGWREYSKDYPGNVVFSPDQKSVLLRLVDGGPGDCDGIANGIIVDPSGPGAYVSSTSVSVGSSDSSGGGGGCFIATAAFGSYMEKHVEILKDFRDLYLLKSRPGSAFVKAYYKYSPPIADVIARYTVLKIIIRIGLMPLIIFAYILIHVSLFYQSVIFLFIMCMLAISYTIRKARRVAYANNLETGVHNDT